MAAFAAGLGAGPALALALGVTNVAAQNPFHNAADAVEARYAHSQPVVSYALRIAAGDTTGFTVEMRIHDAPDTFRLAMMTHPEYDDRYWRFVTGLRAESPRSDAVITRLDSALWRVSAPGGEVVVRYRLQLPTITTPTRSAWRAFVSATGGLVGGPHSFMYIVGNELAPVHVTLDLPSGWEIATGLESTTDPRIFFAPTADLLIDSPIMVGRFRSWPFVVDGVPHRVAYWPLPNAAPFDTVHFVADIEKVVRQAIAVFGRAPYRDYTFLVLDGAFGGLEHTNSVIIGAPSASLARDPDALLPQTAHEFFHTWNEVRIRPVEYRGIDYHPAPVSTGVWWIEGVTMFYADLLLRRAGLRAEDSTRISHLAATMERYFGSSGNSLLSPEQVSLVANTTNMMDYGDDNGSVHVQGELLGDMLDLIVRDATDGRRSLDDVMRSMMERYSGTTGYTSADIEHTVDAVCSCTTHGFFEDYVRRAHPFDLNRYLALIGMRSRIASAPSVDGRGTPSADVQVSAWLSAGNTRPRLRVFERTSAWASAGLHTGDTVRSINGAPITSVPEFRAAVSALKVGDSVRIEVGRPTGPYRAAFSLPQLHHPVVTIEEIPGASDRQRRLRAEWLSGR
jgi:predicted metalloprotease with PDZ domain